MVDWWAKQKKKKIRAEIPTSELKICTCIVIQSHNKSLKFGDGWAMLKD